MKTKAKKQVEALKDLNLKDHKKQLAHDYEDKLLISKEREIFKNIYNKRLDKINELREKTDDDNLVLTTITTRRKTDFSKQDGSLNFRNKI